MANILALRQTAVCSRYDMADRAQVSRFRAWLIESGRVRSSPEEETALRRALVNILQERENRFYTLLLEQERT